jgi:hypothetical protein
MTETVLSITLPEPFLLLNRTMRMHPMQVRKYQQRMAWQMRAALGALSVGQMAPMARAHVRIERHSVGVPDQDGLHGGAKQVIDCLLPVGKPFLRGGKYVFPHPCGIGVVADDGPGVMVQEVVSVRVPRRDLQRTVVTITALPTAGDGTEALMEEDG